MYPELVDLGNWPLRTFLVAEILALFLGSWWALRRAAERDIPRRIVIPILFLVMVCLMVGCRLYFILVHWGDFTSDPGGMLVTVRAGTGQLGGLLLSIGALAVVSRRCGVSLAEFGSILLPSWFLGVAIGRLGCLASGCCFGLPTDSLFGLHFPAGCRASRIGASLLAGETGVTAPGSLAQAAAGPALHPTQLYAAAGALLCLGFFWWLERRTGNSQLAVGLSLALFGLSRLVVDHFRYYEESAVVAGWPVSSWLGVGLILLSSLWSLKGVHRRDTGGE